MNRIYVDKHTAQYKIKYVLFNGHDSGRANSYLGKTTIDVIGQLKLEWSTEENAWLYNELETVLL